MYVPIILSSRNKPWKCFNLRVINKHIKVAVSYYQSLNLQGQLTTKKVRPTNQTMPAKGGARRGGSDRTRPPRTWNRGLQGRGDTQERVGSEEVQGHWNGPGHEVFQEIRKRLQSEITTGSIDNDMTKCKSITLHLNMISIRNTTTTER